MYSICMKAFISDNIYMLQKDAMKTAQGEKEL